MSNRGENKGCEILNSPSHFHLQELLNILITFTEWKNEAGVNVKEFVPWQTYVDLCYLIFGLVGLSRCYLQEDKGRTLVQRKNGSDDVEHEFAGIRVRNPKPTIQDCVLVTGRRSGCRQSVFTRINKTNTSGTDKIIYTDELLEPMEKKRKLNS